MPFYDSGNNQFHVDFGNVIEKELKKGDFNVNQGLSKSLSFDGLYNATWSAFVFVDSNPRDGRIDYGEVSTLGKIEGSDGKTQVDFRFEMRSVKMKAKLFSYSKIEGWILDQLQGGGDNGMENQSPVAKIGNWPFSAPSNSPVGFDGWASYDPDGYIKNWEWTIVRQNKEFDKRTSNEGHLEYWFPEPDKYLIRLRVQDNKGLWSTNTDEVVVDVQNNYVQRKVHITGGSDDVPWANPTRFALVNRWSLQWQLIVDNWNNVYDNGFFDVPDGDWFVIAWIDRNDNWVPEPGEPGVVAENTSESWLTTTLSSGTYHYLNFLNYTNVEVKVNISMSGPDLPSEFMPSTSGEAANNTAYTLDLDIQGAPGSESRNVSIIVRDPWWNLYPGAAGEYTFTLGPTGTIGIWNLTGDGILFYHPSPGQDLVQLTIDMDSDGLFGNAGDLFTTAYIYLEAGASVATVKIEDWQWASY